jgi:hypothetical protein
MMATQTNSSATGADYMFTIAKNASILANFDPRIAEAFKESVKEILKIMEERYAATRTWEEKEKDKTRRELK